MTLNSLLVTCSLLFRRGLVFFDRETHQLGEQVPMLGIGRSGQPLTDPPEADLPGIRGVRWLGERYLLHDIQPQLVHP